MKKILIVVDMQNDFVDGALGSAQAQAIVPNVCMKIAAWDGDIAITLDTHGEDYLNTAEGKWLPIAHCIQDSDGVALNAEVARALAARSNIKSFHKPTFGSAELLQWLAARDYAQVQLVGLCTDVCVISNAMLARAALPNAEIIVDAACCAGVTERAHETALTAMRACNIRII